MKKGIYGKKLGMTQIFDQEGLVIPVTVVEVEPCLVVRKKTVETDGYNALVVATGKVREKHMNKPMKGQFDKIKLSYRKYIKELRLDDVSTYNVGDEIKADIFAAGEIVDVQGVSKGKGFQGVIKRHGQHIGPKGHGSMYHRRPGSMGPTSSPGRVFPGKKLPGQTGKDTVTVQNLQVVKVDMDKEVILIKGSVPGYKNSILRIKEAAKTPASKVTK
ncbi:MAG: 50S ribosomal protein L3 [Clostridia bacterium]|nr:50S ribosomal protein L3 [Clostridia bacterium]